MTGEEFINSDVKNDTGIEDANNGNGRKSTLKSDRSKSSLEIPEDVTELVDEAIRAYEFRVKYYEELIRETVNEFEGGLKRAHVDELSILIEEASEETKQMQSVCQKIVRSLGRLIPVIYQSIEILEFQVKADTEHLLAMEHEWTATDALETVKDGEEGNVEEGSDQNTVEQQVKMEKEQDEPKTERELDEEVKAKLGNVKLIRSIDRIEKQIVKGPMPPKVQMALSKARKLGAALIGFLDESKNVRSLFKEAQNEASSAAVVNFLAQASARTTESSQQLAFYYGNQSVENVKEIEIQTSRQVTRLKTELLQRTKTSLLKQTEKEEEEEDEDKTMEERIDSDKKAADPMEAKEGADNDPKESISPDVGKSSPLINENGKETTEEKRSDFKKNQERSNEDPQSKGKAKEGGKKPAGKKDKAGAGKEKSKKGKATAKEKETPKGKKSAVDQVKQVRIEEPPAVDVQEPSAERPWGDQVQETEEERMQGEQEEEHSRRLESFLKRVKECEESHQAISEQLAEYHVRSRQVQDEMKAAEKVFTKFDTKHRVNLEELIYMTIDNVFHHLSKIDEEYGRATESTGALMECLEEATQGKEELEMHDMLLNQLESSEEQANDYAESLRESMTQLEQLYDKFKEVKCIWEVEIPTAVMSEAREKLTALRDINYRVQFNRKELVKVSAALLRELESHEWAELVEIQLLGVPGKEVERVVALIEKQTVSNESYALKTVADIDRMTRSVGLQKVAPLEDVYCALPELEFRFTQSRTLLNNIQKLMVECKQNVNKLMEDPAKKWSILKIPRSNVASASDCPIAVFRAPEECCPLVKGMDVRLKHAWEKSALFGSQLLVSEVIYFPHPPELPCNVLLGISHGVASLSEAGGSDGTGSDMVLIIKQTFDGVDWEEVASYKNHLFYSYPDNKTSFPQKMVFAEIKTSQLALAYCVVVEYKDGRAMKQAAPQLYTESKKVFREGGKLFATQNKHSHLVVPKDSFQYLSSVSVKSVTVGSMIEQKLLRAFPGLSAVSPLYSVDVETPMASHFTKFTLVLPYPQQMDDIRRPTTAKITVLAYEKLVKQWVLLTNTGSSNDVISVQGGGMCHVSFPPLNIARLLVVNGHCEQVYNVPEYLEFLLAKVPRKPYADDEILDDNCLRQIVDKLTLEFDRFAIVLGISTSYRNKARVSSKTNVMQQKFEILREWRRKNVDSGDLCVKILKSLRSEIVGRYDVADWLEGVVIKERNQYWQNREKYQHVQPATYRRDYLFSPATVATDEPFLGGKILEEPRTHRPNSRGLSDVSFHEEDEDNIDPSANILQKREETLLSDQTELTDYGDGDEEFTVGNDVVAGVYSNNIPVDTDHRVDESRAKALDSNSLDNQGAHEDLSVFPATANEFSDNNDDDPPEENLNRESAASENPLDRPGSKGSSKGVKFALQRYKTDLNSDPKSVAENGVLFRYKTYVDVHK